MLKLELTSVLTGKKVLLTGSTFALADTKEGTMINNGIHNNGGFTVKEEYDTVAGMIRRQLEPDTRTYQRRTPRSYYIAKGD